MKLLKETIPSDFYKSSTDHPVCYDVSDLIGQLKRLPADLPIRQDFNIGCELHVYNIKTNAHLSIEEVEL